MKQSIRLFFLFFAVLFFTAAALPKPHLRGSPMPPLNANFGERGFKLSVNPVTGR